MWRKVLPGGEARWCKCAVRRSKVCAGGGEGGRRGGSRMKTMYKYRKEERDGGGAGLALQDSTWTHRQGGAARR